VAAIEFKIIEVKTMQTIRLKTLLSTMSLLCILTALIVAPIPQANSQLTFGPRLDQIYGRFVQGPAAQAAMLYSNEVNIWFDIRDPVLVRALEDDYFTISVAPETFLFYYIAFNMRDQENPSGGGDPWRTESAPGEYYTYSGLQYKNYVPLNDTAFRHALAHCIPKDEIVATIYGGISAAAISSVVPKAQREWYNPGVDGHSFNPGDPTANTTYPQSHDACSILRAAGYAWGNATAPNPAPKYSPTDPDGNWLDPHTALAADNPGTPWNDTLGSPMNHITLAGVAEAIAPDSYGRDDMCYREFRAIGLPIQHVAIGLGFLMQLHQFDMYAEGWKVGRFPDHLYGFFHSSQDMIGGYNFPGINDTELDAKLETVQFSWNSTVVKQACFDAQDMVAEKLPYIVTVTRQLVAASAATDVPSLPDTLKGVVNSPVYGSENDYTFCSLHWESNIHETTNPYGIGGTVHYIVGSTPTNYHPGYASTTDEWSVIGRLFDGLINVDPYTHENIAWLATKWDLTEWDYGGAEMGMNMTFWLRDDIYYHDSAEFNASVAGFSLEFARDQQIPRAKPMWQNLVNVQVHSQYCFSVLHNVQSRWILNDVAGPNVWLVNDAACWATMFPPHIYAGTDINFSPEATPHRIVHMGETVGTGDGSTVLFTLGNAPVETPAVGDPARVVYLDGTPTTTYTINTTTGEITFTTAPGTGVAITADYLEEGIADLTCLVGTGPFVYQDGPLGWGGFANLSAYRPEASPVTTQWWMSVQGYDGLVEEQFHWIGDCNRDGIIDIYDLTYAALAYATTSSDPRYDPKADTSPEPTYHTNDGRVDMRDIVEISKAWGKQRDYA